MFDHVLNTLSPQFQAFISKLLGEEVLEHIYEALQDPRWREALMEEMKALEKNRT